MIIAAALLMTSCTTKTCVDTTYMNGEVYSTFEYDPIDGACYCDEYTYTSGNSTITNVCSSYTN